MDREIRRLERLIAMGDVEAHQRLLQLLFRTDQIDPHHIFITEDDPRNRHIVLGYRLSPNYRDSTPENLTYRHHGRWIPDADTDAIYRLVGMDRAGPVDLYLVYSPEPIAINYDTTEALFYDEDPELDAFIESNFQYPGQLIELLEGGAVLLRHPVVLHEIDASALYHPEDYTEDDIHHNEEPITFPWREITVVAKDPGEAPKIVTLWNRFENFQLICDKGTQELEIDYYQPSERTRCHDGVEPENIFDDVYMLVSEAPWNKEPNFNIFRPPAVPRNHPRIVEMLKEGTIVGDVESLFQPQIQTIMGSAVFVRLTHEAEPDWDSLPWPWNEYAKEQGYPVQKEVQGLSDDDIVKVLEFLTTGVKPE